MQDWFRLLRVHQWTKNAFCLVGAFFGPQGPTGQALTVGFGVAAVFCMASSAVYVWNDILDRKLDQGHPAKRHRPLASGRIAVVPAAVVGVLLAVGAVGGAAFLLPQGILACLLLYFVNNSLYSAWLKHFILVDVLSVALGFGLRLYAGVWAVGDIPTTWVVLCTFFLAVFLGFSKRRCELANMQGVPKKRHRPVLSQYTLPQLDLLVSSAAVMTVLCFALFTTSGKSPSLTLTVPIVFYAITHYQKRVLRENIGEEPEWLLVRDPHVYLSLLAFLTAYFGIVWHGTHLLR